VETVALPSLESIGLERLDRYEFQRGELLRRMVPEYAKIAKQAAIVGFA
jgi:hypothetical protein